MTYNQNAFVTKALDSIAAQKTTFDFDILIADDCSTDGTKQKVLEFSKKSSNTLLILQKKNIGAAKNHIDLISKPLSKYIAYLEGDDYWTDPYKLQKQVDYLEANSDCSFCFTDCQVKRKNNLQEIHPNIIKKTKFDGIDLADQPGSIAQPCTWLVRRECIQNLPNWVTSRYTADWCMQVHFSKFGKGGYIPENTAVYRIHDKGVWSKLNPYEGWRKNLAFYKTALQQFADLGSKKRLRKRIQLTIHDALELANVEANKSEIRKWLLLKLTSNPFSSVQQSIHSFKLILVF
ncbi:glycosyltransferase [Opitutales bacterium]|nr:glycosyltransferase [Opitutales bacterium]